MHFEIFDHMDRSGEQLAVQYENRLTMLEACDRAGFHGYHLAEHHQTPLGFAPSPSVFLAAAAQRTKNIRLGALVFTLSLYHPLRILDEICMLDHLSKGRLELGLGRGISPIEVNFYGVDAEKSPEIYGEAVADPAAGPDVEGHQLRRQALHASGTYRSSSRRCRSRSRCGTAWRSRRAPTAPQRTPATLSATARRKW